MPYENLVAAQRRISSMVSDIAEITAFNRALVIGSSGGIGAAFVRELRTAGEPRVVETLSRQENGLDITDEASVARAAAQLCGRPFDLIVNATGALEIDGAGPEKSFAAIEPGSMAKAFAVNAIGPALLLKHFGPLLARDRPARFVTLSARVGSIGDNRLGGWVSYRASKAGLNQILRCASIEFSRTHPNAALIALHPGTIETALTQKFARGRYTATADDAARQILATIAAVTPEQSGSFIAYDGAVIPW